MMHDPPPFVWGRLDDNGTDGMYTDAAAYTCLTTCCSVELMLLQYTASS